MKKEIIDQINNIYWQYGIGPQVIKNPKDLAVITSMCAFGKNVNRGPIAIADAILDGTKITLITLGGTQFKDGQATRFLESKLSMKGKENDYIKALINLFKDGTISKDKPIIISGISLGGMIAQQLLNYEDIINNFNIIKIITFGSPLTKPYDRKGISIVRFTEAGDIVPKLGQPIFNIKNKKRKKELDKIEERKENGNYKTRLESHALSYVSHPNWENYDIFGDKPNTHKLEITSDIKWYEAPIITK